MPDKLTLAFVSSAFNEEENLEELYLRCRAVHAELEKNLEPQRQLGFRFVVADNGSEDTTLNVLESLSRRDSAVVALANLANYGPESSVVNALQQVMDCDLIVILCSDLQDPPEIAGTMARTLLDRKELDAVLAVKKSSSGGLLIRMGRRMYYRILGYSSRLQVVPAGFHGFGCYRQSVIHEALRYWECTDLNFRQCLTNACQSPRLMDYEQAERLRGVSSYRGWGYLPEALRALLAGDAAASRLALMIGSAGSLLALILGVALLVNFLNGASGYQGGVPTVMGLVLISFTLQMLMFAVLSRQIEALRMGGFRPKVRYRMMGNSATEPRANP